MRINKVREKALTLFLFLALCEFLYADYTGQKTSMVLISFFAVGALMFFVENRKININDVFKVVIALWVLCWSINVQSVRYFLTLMSLFFWAKHRFRNLEKIIKIMAIIGVIMAILQFVGGRTRVSGFYANSPTQLACTLYLFESYLLVKMVNQEMDKKTLGLCALCIITIFLTETRSVLLAASIVFLFFFIIALINSSKIKSKKKLFFLILIIALPIVALNSSGLMSYMQSKFHRTNIDASNYTRMYMYNTMFNLLKTNPQMLLIGGKGGFAHNLFGATAGQYLPVHQDFLLIIVEYGVVGLISILITYLWRKKQFFFFLMIFGICSFHNAVLNPVLMVLMAITMADLKENNDMIFAFKNGRKFHREQ